MGRDLRIIDPDLTYHVGSRGSDGRPVFLNAEERSLYLLLLDRVVAKHDLRCLGYCLMTNHVHLLLRAPKGGLSEAMQRLNGSYSLITNRRRRRRAHLFQNRFFAAAVENEEHWLNTHRYIVLNPIRAGLCDDPADWPWSSYRAAAGFEYPPPVLALDELWPLLGRTPDEAWRRYRRFVADGVPEARAAARADRVESAA